MTPVVCVELLNLACCAIEAARGYADWCSKVTNEGSISVVRPGELGLSAERDSGQLVSPALSILVVAGTVTHDQAPLVQQHYEALPEPRAVVAFGVCTISGGPYWDSYSVLPGIEGIVPVDVMVPGCPPLPSDVGAALDQLVASELAAAHV